MVREYGKGDRAGPNRVVTRNSHRPGREHHEFGEVAGADLQLAQHPGRGRRSAAAVTSGSTVASWVWVPLEDQVELVDPDSAGLEVGLHRATLGQAAEVDGGNGREQ